MKDVTKLFTEYIKHGLSLLDTAIEHYRYKYNLYGNVPSSFDVQSTEEIARLGSKDIDEWYKIKKDLTKFSKKLNAVDILGGNPKKIIRKVPRLKEDDASLTDSSDPSSSEDDDDDPTPDELRFVIDSETKEMTEYNSCEMKFLRSGWSQTDSNITKYQEEDDTDTKKEEPKKQNIEESNAKQLQLVKTPTNISGPSTSKYQEEDDTETKKEEPKKMKIEESNAEQLQLLKKTPSNLTGPSTSKYQEEDDTETKKEEPKKMKIEESNAEQLQLLKKTPSNLTGPSTSKYQEEDDTGTKKEEPKKDKTEKPNAEQLQSVMNTPANPTNIGITKYDKEDETESENLKIDKTFTWYRYPIISRKRKISDNDEKSKVSDIPTPEPENRHLMFFNSILPTLNKLNDNQTLLFQTQVTQLLADFN